MSTKLQIWLLGRAEIMVIALKRSRWINRRRATRLLSLIDAHLIERPRSDSQLRRSK
jgi:hypothetical protein